MNTTLQSPRCRLVLTTASLLATMLNAGCSATSRQTAVRSPSTQVCLSEKVIQDKIRGAWLGQMIGVSYGFPTEFYARYIWQLFPQLHQIDGVPQSIYRAYEGGPIPMATLPVWTPEMINGGYTQDDLYVEVPFMVAMRDHGVKAGWEVLGREFAASQFPLYHANLAARDNLRAGIPAPLSGHPAHNGHADDIDWQIESDFIGMMTLGQPRAAADIAFRAGHLMNYGDGVYGGVFVATMISTAFTAPSLDAIVRAGIESVPAGSRYREVLDQTFASWKRGDSFDLNLAALYQRWGTDDRCIEWAGAADPLNIDAKLNGAFILLGLLYGKGDLHQSIRYATACGQDSDCNPSNVGSVLGAFLGRDALASDRTDWLSRLDSTQRFQTTTFTLDELIDLNIELARSVVQSRGGSAPRGGTWRIPRDAATDPLILEQWAHHQSDSPALAATATVESDGTVRVQASASGPVAIRSYQWFFGDFSFASGPAHLHRYSGPGSYELIAYAADIHGNTSCKVVPVEVPGR